MEDLFSTNISFNERNGVYRVIFENDRYVFLPDNEDPALPTFSFKREQDEWHDMELIDPALRKQGVDALENYLLSQH